MKAYVSLPGPRDQMKTLLEAKVGEAFLSADAESIYFKVSESFVLNVPSNSTPHPVAHAGFVINSKMTEEYQKLPAGTGITLISD